MDIVIRDIDGNEYMANTDNLLPVQLRHELGDEPAALAIGNGKTITIDSMWQEAIISLLWYPAQIVSELVFARRNSSRKHRDLCEVKQELYLAKQRIATLSGEIDALREIQARMANTQVSDLGIGNIVDTSPEECYSKSHLDAVEDAWVNGDNQDKLIAENLELNRKIDELQLDGTKTDESQDNTAT